MGHDTGWKIATLVLSCTSLALGAALLVRPVPTADPAAARAPPVDAVAATADADVPTAPERSRERVRVSVADDPPPEQPPAPDVDEQVAATRHRLAQLGIDDVCRRELFTTATAPAELVLERLLQDRERAAELMVRWYGERRSEEWTELNLQLSPHFPPLFLAVAGDAAAELLRADWRETRDIGVMTALVRHGDAETLRLLDEDHRAAHPRRRENPHLLVSLGDAARELVWGWIEDPRVEHDVRMTAIEGMWTQGGEAARQRLWRETDATIAIVHFAPHGLRDDNRWSERLRDRTERMLDDSDPWVRLHAAMAAMQNSFAWGNDLARRGEAVATETERLPKPDGRDAAEWRRLLHRIQMHRPGILSRAGDEAAVREALGLE